MRFALLESGVSLDMLNGISCKELQSLYRSLIKKSKKSKTNSGLQQNQESKRTYCTWNSRARRSAINPKSAFQYYKMDKEQLKRVLEPFKLDRDCLNTTAIAKLCCLYHLDIAGVYPMSFLFASFCVAFSSVTYHRYLNSSETDFHMFHCWSAFKNQNRES
jgi:hypothetical protein